MTDQKERFAKVKRYTIDDLGHKSMTKEKLFVQLSGSWDYALPKDWLDEFCLYCRAFRPKVERHIITGTTVWTYPPWDKFLGCPFSPVIEVAEAIEAFRTEDYTEK